MTMKKKNEVTVTEIYSLQKGQTLKLPLYLVRIPAGFPSPADDYIDKKLDLNELLIEHQSATFFVKVVGDSMLNAGIHSGDILIVDRAIEPANNKIVVAIVDGEFTVKRIRQANGKVYLIPENSDFTPIELTEEMDCRIWGVVTYAIHPLK